MKTVLNLDLVLRNVDVEHTTQDLERMLRMLVDRKVCGKIEETEVKQPRPIVN